VGESQQTKDKSTRLVLKVQANLRLYYASAIHCAFALLELDGQDLRREPIEKRKARLAKLLKGSH
jgi:ATP-dependent DNA ligase